MIHEILEAKAAEKAFVNAQIADEQKLMLDIAKVMTPILFVLIFAISLI